MRFFQSTYERPAFSLFKRWNVLANRSSLDESMTNLERGAKDFFKQYVAFCTNAIHVRVR